MNQLLSQLPRQEANSMILQSRWKDLHSYFQAQNSERSTDIDDLLSNLSKKIDHNAFKENKNYQIVSSECNKLSKQVVDARGVLASCESMQTEFQLIQTQRNSQFIKEEILRREQMMQNKLMDADSTVNDLRRQYQEADRKSLTEAEETYQEFHTSKQMLKAQLLESKKNHNEALSQIYDQTNKEFEEMFNFVSQYQEKRKQEESKMGYMIEQLTHDLHSTMEMEQKAGCIVYDCLLSTIEDSYSKLHEKRTLK